MGDGQFLMNVVFGVGLGGLGGVGLVGVFGGCLLGGCGVWGWFGLEY